MMTKPRAYPTQRAVCPIKFSFSTSRILMYTKSSSESILDANASSHDVITLLITRVSGGRGASSVDIMETRTVIVVEES